MECLGVLLKIAGNPMMAGYLEKLDSIKLAKVKEFSEDAVVCVGGKNSAVKISFSFIPKISIKGKRKRCNKGCFSKTCC